MISQPYDMKEICQPCMIWKRKVNNMIYLLNFSLNSHSRLGRKTPAAITVLLKMFWVKLKWVLRRFQELKAISKKYISEKNQFVFEQCPSKEETNNARGVFIEVHQGGTRLSTAKESYHQSWGANSIIRLLGTQTNCSMAMWQTW